MNEPFSLAFRRGSPFGEVAGIHLPAGVEAVTSAVLARLHPDERAAAEGMKGRRQIEFTGGRLAVRTLRPDLTPVATGERGEPLCPPGLSLSLTHKQDLAVAMVGDAAQGTIGIDLEGDGRARMTIAERVLRPEELTAVRQLDEADQWDAVLLRFALKEAAYKAIHPHLNRFVGFHEARVGLSPVKVEIVTEPSLQLEAYWESLGGPRVLACVRARTS